MKSYYDTIIVGAGPAGLALAQTLSQNSDTILVMDSMDTIGGCHRVVRTAYEGNELFTEHGPRIYIDNYKNFQTLLEDMGQDFYSLFTPYHFSIRKEAMKRLNLSFREFHHLSMAFLLFLWDENYGKKITVQQFGKKYKFSPETMDMLDRTARMTDGSGIDRYTLHQFFQLLNQQFLYGVYQPKLPNDKGFLPLWENFLKEEGVDFALGYDVVSLRYKKEINSIYSVWAVDKKTHNTIEIRCGRVVLAVPPHAIAHLFRTCHKEVQNSFMPYPQLLRFVEKTNYLPYLSITFHWTTKQEIPNIHGFPVGEWGVIFIVLSDYMDMSNEYSKTLISCCISYLDRPSGSTGKTANQCLTDEVIEETFQQLKTVMPLLSKPNVALLSPQNFYDNNKKKWTQYDVSYFPSPQQKPLPNHGKIKNLYNVGAHNGNSPYSFTTLESAATNAIVLSHYLNPLTQQLYPVQKMWTLRHVLKIIFGFLLILLFCLLGFFWKKKSRKKK